MRLFGSGRRFPVISLAAAVLLCGAGSMLLGSCGPFTDISDATFCPFVLEILTLGITTGTTPTTYDPAGNVSRLQMAAFLSRTVDGALKRSSPRAAMRRFWTTQGEVNLGLTTVPSPGHVDSDGLDIWVAGGDYKVSRVRASDGKLLEAWTGATGADGVLTAMGKVFVTGNLTPGVLYRADPSQPAGAVTIVSSSLGDLPAGIAFDGGRIWTANVGGTVSIVTPLATLPWAVTTFNVSTGFSQPAGVLYDGANIWVTDRGPGTLIRLDSNGAVLQTVTVGPSPQFPVFDGTNIWVPSVLSNSVSVVRASTGAVLATLTGNGLGGPFVAAFDGQRILVTSQGSGNLSLWKAADLTPIEFFTLSDTPFGACSDGINFWITEFGLNHLARF